MSDETTLLSCPFCGGEAEMRTKKDICLDRLFYRYRCNDCHAGIVEWSACVDGKEWSAAAKWNTRAELGSGTCERIAELEQLIRDMYWEHPIYLFEQWMEDHGIEVER